MPFCGGRRDTVAVNFGGWMEQWDAPRVAEWLAASEWGSIAAAALEASIDGGSWSRWTQMLGRSSASPLQSFAQS